ncbi:MAG: KpsF/GutQ family sugar-phosphate isomerase [Gammaproteobacteria bacterium]|nr:KpsF/GutQ family sugar-phosphate isomerase [Gammaproteobacteria bacterium]MCD8541942.1 KpsF/GutQ family sugar-phosphate isomerase [Gammaproteobacteria bacterium]
MPMTNNDDILRFAQQVFTVEIEALQRVSTQLNEEFCDAVQSLLNCTGRVVVTGMGKSGHIGSKIAATLASTGTPAFFVHPGEASHGDLGMITRNDVVIAISNSGETQELVTLLPLLKRFNVYLIAMTGKKDSTLAKIAHVHLDVAVEKEACPLGLAPTSSTTATLAMGDALAVTTLQCRGFTAEDFALSHPGGTLGKRLLLKVKDLMHSGEKVPQVSTTALLTDAIAEMSAKTFGITAIVDAEGKLCGVFSDGDIRRVIQTMHNLNTVVMADIMTVGGKTISDEKLAAEALEVMEKNKITSLFIIDALDKPIGIIHLHDILRSGIA